MRRHWTLAAVLGIALWLPAVAHGETFTVAEPTDAALRAAVTSANDAEGADTILLPAGTIVLEEIGLNVYDDLTIIGAAGGSVIDGSEIGQRILDVHDETATQIEGVTFVGATRGAIGFQDLIDDSAAQSLSAAEGNQLVVKDSTFDDNDAGGRGTGGAIDFTPSVGDASLIVSGSTFVGNRADGDGFGRGGAIRLASGAMTVENSTFTGNVAAGSNFDSGGGAIAVDRGQASLKHVTIASNRAENGARGGGIGGPILQVDIRRALSFVPVTVTNSIVAQNTSEIEEGSEGLARAAALDTLADDCDTEVGSGGGNVESATTCGFNDASDKRNADPGLGPLAANGGATRTMAIGNTSPAYNAAVTSACVATDQRGIARPQFGACDSGAYELAPVSVQPSPVVTPAPVAAQRSCLSVRKFRIRLRVPKGERVRSAAVFVNGKKVAVRRGKRLTATVDLRGLTLDRYRVRIVLKLENGRTITGVRRYWTCTPAIRHTRPPKV
jgi:hypothetical protein